MVLVLEMGGLVAGVVVGVVVAAAAATRSQEGHMVRVVAGSCMQNGFEELRALNSCNSLCSLLFSSVKLSQILFKYSQSTSVCFNLVLNTHTKICNRVIQK